MREPVTTLPAAQVLKMLSKRSKFNVDTSESGKAARTHGGVVYASGAEANYARLLDIRLKSGDVRYWWGQSNMPLIVNGVKICVLRVDFKIVHTDKTVEYVEVKGFRTPVYKLKEKLFKALYPSAKLTVIEAKDVRG